MVLARFLVNPLNTELNPIRHLLALVGARHIVHVSRIRVKFSAGRLAVVDEDFFGFTRSLRRNFRIGGR